MEKRKSTILTITLMMLFTMLMAISVSAAEINTIELASSKKTYQYTIKADEYVPYIPVKVSSPGEVHLDIKFKTQAEKVNIVLSSKASMGDSDAWLKTVLEGRTDKQYNLSTYVKKACTLYLCIFEGRESHDMDITITAYQRQTAAGGTLKKGKWTSGYASYNVPVYYKVAVPSSGSLKVDTSGSTNGAAQIELLNSRKKTINYLGSSSEKTSYYGVKKGTYYIKLLNDGTFRLRYTLETVKGKNNTKKSRAVNLKKGKTEKGVFAIGDKKYERYYKLVLKKNQTITGNISVKSNGSYSCFISQRVGKKDKTVKYTELERGNNKVRAKLKKGTYYLMIYTVETGGYSIQWK